MHLSSWLLLAVCYLSTGVTAFYPYKLPDYKPGSGSLPHRLKDRFYPILPPGAGDNGGKLTLDIKKAPRPSKIRRDNNFNAILGDPTTLPNSMPIHNDGHDFSYFSTIRVGSEGKEVWMLLDTGAANTWLMSTDCTTAACQSHTTFGPSDSESFNLTTQEFSVSYGTGEVSGVIATDTMSFAGFIITPSFGSVREASDEFLYYPMDGILGLGLKDPDLTTQPPTIMQVIMERRLLQQNVLGINLQRHSDGARDGQITFGSIDHSKFSGELRYTHVVPDAHRWEIPIEDAIIDGTNAGFTGKSAIVDTGTSFILMPEDDARAFHALIPGSVEQEDVYFLPCNTNSTVEISISGTRFDVSPADYVGDPSDDLCRSRVAGHRPFGDNQWLLGDVFLKNVYTVFDFDSNQIGFAPRNGTRPSPTDGNFSPSSTVDPTSPASTEVSPGDPTPDTPGDPGNESDGAAAGFSIPISLALVSFIGTSISWPAF